MIYNQCIVKHILPFINDLKFYYFWCIIEHWEQHICSQCSNEKRKVNILKKHLTYVYFSLCKLNRMLYNSDKKGASFQTYYIK